MLLNCGVGEDSWESLGQQGDQTSQSERKSVLTIHWKDWCWSWNSNTLATWCDELTHWKRPWCWERLKAGGQEGDKGWDGWMAASTRWTRVWASSGSWWLTREAWCAAVLGVAKSQTRLSDWTSITLHISIFECVVSELSSFHLSIFYSLVNKTQSLPGAPAWCGPTLFSGHGTPTSLSSICTLGSLTGQFGRSVVSNSSQPHGPHHARLPCPSRTPRACSNSCPQSQWCHPTISSSVVPFSSCLQSSPASGSFQMSQLFASGGQSIAVSASASVLPMNIQDWSALGWTGWISLQSKGLSRVFSNTTVQKHQFFSTQLSL